MATLSQALRSTPQQYPNQLTKCNGGQLQEQSLAGAMQNIGLQTAPTTPLGAQMIGANPDVAKMTGTQAQLSAANNNQQAQQAPQNSLQTALREQQARTQTTGQEQNTIQKSADMQALGGLGDRVTGFIQSEMNKLTAQTQPVAVAAQTQFQNKDISSYKDDLAALRANPSDQNLMLKVQQELGMDINTQLSTDQINQLYQTASQAIGAGAAGTIADSLQVSNLLQDPQFGYDAATLSNLLGVPAAELSNYTVKQLTDKVNQVQADEFNKSQQQQQQATSSVTGQAERDLARQQGRDLSATGIRATEDDFNKLTQSIQNADQVSFGGKTYAVGDLLKDDTISGIVKDYIEAPDGSQIKHDLETTEPQLANFIKNNQAALAQAASQLEAGATEFKSIQADNKKAVSDAFGGIELSPAVKAALVPQANTLQSSRVDPNTVPILKYANIQGPAAGQKIANEINDISTSNPDAPKEIASLNFNQINNLGIGKPGSNWDTMKNYNNRLQQVQSIDPSNSDALIQQQYADVGSLSEAQSRIQAATGLSALGLPTGMNIINIDPSTLKDTILAGKQPASITDAANGNVQTWNKTTLGSPKMPAPGSLESSIYYKTQGLSQDGSISYAEIRDQNSPVRKMSLDELIKMEDLSNSGGNIDKKGINEARQEATNNNTRVTIDQNFQGGDFTAAFNSMNDLLKQDPRKVNPDMVKDRIVKAINDEINSGEKIDSIMAAYKKAKEIGVLTPQLKDRYQQIANAYASNPSVGQQVRSII